ncbi:membrane protein [Hylemonella gracilis str. Niagara R]|uniref:Membrane protein n=1 Tax=Hylemonella gracilis str. Niagara R TaxID=1458275 RepID=A0A016XF28_9BURK|nr:outer membrane beta-barrel protein [Hylemonella gracilis]EYC50505.1 membrane protein [Hylemonella gracilis str. Niagara R]
MTQSRFLLSGICVALATLTLATGASAQNSMYDDGNSYFELTTGRTHFGLGGGNGFYHSDHLDRSYGVAMGRYFQSSNLGMELGYTDFGDVHRLGRSTEAQGINLSLIGRAQLGNAFNVLGQIGGVYSRTDVSSRPGSGASDTGTEHGLDWTYGVGLEYVFTRRVSGVLQYDGYRMDFADKGRERITNLALGLRYLY